MKARKWMVIINIIIYFTAVGIDNAIGLHPGYSYFMGFLGGALIGLAEI